MANSTEALTGLLRDYLKTVVPEGVVFDVVGWYNPSNMISDHLQKHRVDVLVSVKRDSCTTKESRVYNMVPKSETVNWEISIYLTNAPHYGAKMGKEFTREEMVQAVKEFFRLYPALGTEKSWKNTDHAVGQLWVYTTSIIVAELNENLKP